MSALKDARRKLDKTKSLPPVDGLPTPDAAVTMPAPSRNWPDPPADEVYHGLAGDIIRTLEPASEADPVGLLLQLLVLFGNMVGRGPHFAVEGDKHYTNQFAVLVGPTAAGRKGTSFGRVRELFADLDRDWLDTRIVSGTSSGEGLVWCVRDPIAKRERVGGRKGQPPSYEEVESDPGVSDKRAVVYEPEFAQVLKQAERQGNTASVYLRQFWDGREVVQSLTKNNAAKATAAHLSVIGHITSEELVRYLTATETANGFANRFLVVCVRRSKYLPDGAILDPKSLAPLKERLAAAVAFARTVGMVTRHPSARFLWHGVYPLLTGERAGLAGALSARAAPHVMRLAMVYALLDHSPVIRPVHLMAGIALWDYCERSVNCVFGDRTGSPVADEVRDLLRAAPAGLTRTELVAALGRHTHGDRLTQALLTLQGAGLVRRGEKEDTGGRPAERWFATSRPGAGSPLMAVTCGLFAASPSCDVSDESGESLPPHDAVPAFGRLDRIGRTTEEDGAGTAVSSAAAGSPPPSPDPPPVWDDPDRLFALVKSRGWTWSRVCEWLGVPPTAVFFDLSSDQRRRAVEHLERLAPADHRTGAK